MSPATVATIIINPPQISNQFHKFLAHKTPPFLSPHNCKLIKFDKFVKLNRVIMAIESGSGDGDEYLSSTFEQEVNLIQNGGGVTFHQTLGGLHALANNLSKWIVTVMYTIFILLRHDAFALWAAMGSVLNIVLSVVLKKILKQERPVSGVSSGHGMPSSHAQSIFFAIVFVTLSVVQWQGLNVVTAIFGMLLLALGSYFSWLRVSQRYHTTSQVAVGGVVGSIFSGIWFWAWEASVHKAYNSSLWVQILLVVGTAFCCLVFIQHVIRDWIKGED